MKKFIANVSETDGLIRMFTGIGLVAYSYKKQFPQKWAGIIGVVVLTSGLLNYCPIYDYLQISTKK